MKPGAFVTFGRCRGGRAREQLARRHLDEIACAVAALVAVERALSAFAEFSAGCGNEVIDVFEANRQILTLDAGSRSSGRP